MVKGKFIVFEGIDGSGTSTQSILLKEHLALNSRKVVLTSEPSRGPIGSLIRHGLHNRVTFSSQKGTFDRQMAYLFAADRYDHLYNEVDGLVKLLAESHTVLCTRYVFSSLAYHCNNDEDFAFVKNLNDPFPKPDLVVYIDISVEVALKRIGGRTVKDQYENAEKLSVAKRNYDKILASYPGEFIRINGEEEIERVHAQIADFVDK